jgi:phage baseplate assembly protein V
VNPAEFIRLLENLIRTGTVTEIDEQNWRVRVESGGLETTWLRWNAQRAGAFSIWIPLPWVNRSGYCARGNETAIIGGSLYSNDNPAPGSSVNEMIMTAPDGARFHYDASAGALTVSGVKTARLEASERHAGHPHR